MLVTFECKAYADITYFGDVAKTLLKMMGHSGTIPSAILAEDVPAALERLKSAVAAASAEQPPAAVENDHADIKEPTVQLATRAKPLLELLEAAANAHCNVMWQQR